MVRLTASGLVWLMLLCVSVAPLSAADGGKKDDGKSSAKKADDHKKGGGGHSKADTNPMTFSLDLAFWNAIVFLVLLAILGKFAWGPIMEGLERRETSIANQIEEARVNAEKSAQQLAQYESQLATAAEEAKEIVATARKDAESAKERILAEAQEAAQRERDRASSEIETAKAAALQEIAQRSVDVALSLASDMVRRQLNKDDHDQLIRDALDRFPSNN